MGAHKKVAMAKEGFDGDDSILDSAIDVDYLERPIDDPSQAVLHKEMLLSSQETSREIKFSSESIDFAFTESGRLSEPKSLTIRNSFNFPVQIDWTLMPILSKTTGKQVDNPFKISPERYEIPQNSSFSFNVEFAPYEPSSYFF